jgi:hypothetical protein
MARTEMMPNAIGTIEEARIKVIFCKVAIGIALPTVFKEDDVQ